MISKSEISKQKLQVFRAINEGFGKFNDIKKIVGQKSNELSYNLNSLLKQGLIKKTVFGKIINYELSDKGKELCPYLSIIEKDEVPIVVVTAVAPIKNKKVMLTRKKDEPQKGKFILIGGKAKKEHDVFTNAIEKCKRQVGLEITDLKLKCINEFIEKSKDNSKITYHWIVYFFTATPTNEPENIEWIKLSDISKIELYGEDKLFLKKMINSKTIKITKTIHKEGFSNFSLVKLNWLSSL